MSIATRSAARSWAIAHSAVVRLDVCRWALSHCRPARPASPALVGGRRGASAAAHVSGPCDISELQPSCTASNEFAVRSVSRRRLCSGCWITSNRVVQNWDNYLGDATMAATILDRLIHRAAML